MSVEDFTQAQLLRRSKGAGKLRAARRLERSGRPTKRTYLFRGRVRCGVCGRKMEGSPRVHGMYYRCPARASQVVGTVEAAEAWIDAMERAARGGLDPSESTKSLKEYGNAVMSLALRGLEPKTTEPYRAGWTKRVVPTIGHIPVRMITSGVVDRAAHDWIADGCSMSTIKNTVAVLVRVMEQALRDGIVDRNSARVVGWQSEFRKAEDELENPRALALPDWQTLTTLADALVERSHDQYRGWGDVVRFAVCTAARIGEVSGCRVADIDTRTWTWKVRRQTTTGPGGLVDKGTKGKRARTVPVIPEIRDLVIHRLTALDGKPDARLFSGPKGGRISTAVLRDTTHWYDVVRALGFEHLRRPPPHGADMDGRRWGAAPRPAQGGRPRQHRHHPALPASRPSVDHRGG
ncbi:recombinase zinc beta ribbon domain-containing protein [Saccharopolyspora mangrovi]|uniref:Site-specific integrase n=1 Tax=Saccharopolyspora mangrovi TaxID=3082379 RepID=A0ABU6A538_9PSEU|nr:recombinase zinc beta ribbon domain-containing protein [Saccharopolyspora sp. S2-29]MEB3366683.1 site-specific integrase [Saccharopolyspora sp. S2-29]